MHSLLWRFENESHKSSKTLQLASYGEGETVIGACGGGEAEHMLTVTSWLTAGSVSRCLSRAREEVTTSVSSRSCACVIEVFLYVFFYTRTRTHAHARPRAGGAKRGTFLSGRGAGGMSNLCPLFIIAFSQFITWTKAVVWIIDKIAPVCLSVSKAHVMQWRFCPADGASRLALHLFFFFSVGHVASGGGAASPCISDVLH